MALAEIIDLQERRRSRQPAPAAQPSGLAVPDVWYCVWMPVYFWYLP